MRLSLVFGLAALALAASHEEEQTHAAEHAKQVASELQLDETEGVSVIDTMREAVLRQLRDQSGSGQEINAWVALAAGVALMLDGELTFKWVLMGGFGIAAMLLAQNESAAYWGVGGESPVGKITGIEAGLLAAFITYYSLDAMLLVIGAWFGFFLAHASQKFLVEHGAEAFHDNKWLAFSWYSIFTLFFWGSVARKKHIKMLGFITAFFGGPLVASSICYFFTKSAMRGGLGATQPVMGAWVDFFRLIIGTSDVDVGMWTDKPPLAQGFSYDRVFGCGIWAACFIVGALFHAKVKAAKAKEAAANEEPLLSKLIQVE